MPAFAGMTGATNGGWRVPRGRLEAAPGLSEQAGANAAVLAHLSPVLQQALGAPPLAAIAPHDHMRRLSEALFELFAAAGQQQCLLLAVDNVDQSDQA